MIRTNIVISFLTSLLCRDVASQANENIQPQTHPSITLKRNGLRKSIHSASAIATATDTATDIIMTKHHHNDNDHSFDFYVLSMSYQPEFCYQHRHDGFDGCEDPMDFWKGSLTLHGLWPERNDGTYPSSCSTEKFNHQTVNDIGRTRFDTYWPNVKASSSPSSNAYYSFWEHEWTKHGTCSGLTQDAYFNSTLNHFLETPTIVRENYGSTISKTDLMDAYGGDVVLVCSAGKFLSEVRTCVGKNSKDGTASKSIDCIPEVEQEGSCGDEIKIAKFYSDTNGDDEEDGGNDKLIVDGLLSIL
jgi:ribonuclease T2